MGYDEVETALFLETFCTILALLFVHTIVVNFNIVPFTVLFVFYWKVSGVWEVAIKGYYHKF